MQLPPPTTPVRRTPFHFAVLVRWRLAQLRNAVDQQLRDAPARTFAILLLLVVIWAALYELLALVLHQIGRWELVAVVANQHIFVHFFLLLAVMLAFSNAILAFGSLFGRREAGALLAWPVPSRSAICVKWIEGMLLSSWSFLLLGVPLMLAVARTNPVAWYYYPLFVGHFLGFVIMPATFGLLVAWGVAMYAPRRPLTIAIWAAAFVMVAGGLWVWRAIAQADRADDWLLSLYRQVRLANQPFLPSTWTARGILAAMQQRAPESLLYLGANLANAAFFAWLTINVLGRTWAEAYSRAQQGRAAAAIRSGWFTAGMCDLLFFYLPRKLRLLMLKDLRGFVRDPTQWTQMVIMLGLLVIYAANLKRLPMDLSNPSMRTLLAFLNLMTVSLILATFTSRFVFPLLSLESQQLWLLGLLPTSRATLLLVKFIFSLTMTGLSGLVVMGLAVRALAPSTQWAGLQLAVCLSICIGLSGLSVGIGARFPELGQRNPARIAAGFGGTLNLIVSMLFVGLEMTALALAGLTGHREGSAAIEELTISPLLVPGVLAFGVVVAGVSLWIGTQHFERLEH